MLERVSCEAQLAVPDSQSKGNFKGGGVALDIDEEDGGPKISARDKNSPAPTHDIKTVARLECWIGFAPLEDFFDVVLDRRGFTCA